MLVIPTVTQSFEITKFEECVTAGNPITESYPAQCRTADGQTFTQDIGNELALIDLIQVNTPRPNQEISSPMQVTGRARGPWYFEANFSVELVDETGKQLGIGVAQALEEWMTEEFVPFEAMLEFNQPLTNTGTLRLKKANPSGLKENEMVLEVPVTFLQD